jgi:putative phosphoribosyl transferase
MQFRNRRDAGCRLAEHLARTMVEQPVVIALPRGGVPVGYEIARVLGAPLDVLAVRKLGAPGHAEYGVGAIAEGDALVVDEREARRVGLTGEVRDRKLAVERRELARRATAYRGARPMTEVGGRTAIVVDDGLATGLTALAAVRALRERGAARVILAVPVATPEAVERLSAEADEVIVAHVAPELRGVGEFYDDFTQTQDDEVLDLLARGRAQNTGEFTTVTLRD